MSKLSLYCVIRAPFANAQEPCFFANAQKYDCVFDEKRSTINETRYATITDYRIEGYKLVI